MKSDVFAALLSAPAPLAEHPDEPPRPPAAGRLFRLRLQRNRAARAESLATVRDRPDGQWQARVGGRMRGRTVVGRSRQAVEAAVHGHYNEAMLKATLDINRKDREEGHGKD